MANLIDYIELNHALTTHYRYNITNPGSYVISTDLLSPVASSTTKLLYRAVGLPTDYLDDSTYLDDNYIQSSA